MKSNYFYAFLFILTSRAAGLALLPALLKASPLLLIILSPFLHHLVLSSNLLTLPIFLFAGIFISLLHCSIGFEFGRRHGISGLRWCAMYHLISESKIELLSKWIRYSSPIVLFFIPGPLVAMIAGVSNLKPAFFYKVMIPAQISWVIGCYVLGTNLEIYINYAKTFMIDNWITLTVAFTLLKIIQLVLNRAKLNS